MMQDEYRNEPGSVIGSDFYGATELLGLSDDAIVKKVVANISRCDPRMQGAKVSNHVPSCCSIFRFGFNTWSGSINLTIIWKFLLNGQQKPHEYPDDVELASYKISRSRFNVYMPSQMSFETLKMDPQFLCSLMCKPMWKWEARIAYNSSCKSSFFQTNSIDSYK